MDNAQNEGGEVVNGQFSSVNDTAIVTETTPHDLKKKLVRSVVLSCVLIVLIAAGILYVSNGSLFGGNTPYKEESFVADFISSIAKIKKGTYTVAGSFKVEPRDTDAIPIVVVERDVEHVAQYERDVERAQEIQSVLYALNDYFYSQREYPMQLGSLVSFKSASYPITADTITDPLTQKNYTYTKSGTNFNLDVVFETTEAIDGITRYSYNADMYKVQGKTITFTADSDSFVYLSDTLPPTFLESLAEITQYIPPELNILFAIKVTADLGDINKTALWDATLSAEGDLGDLTYKVNIDARKHDKSYFLRINNLPSLFGIQIPKGQWYEITSDDVSDSTSGLISAEDIANTEEEYAKMRDTLSKLFRVVAKVADTHGLYQFVSEPFKVEVDGETVYQYELRVRKEAIKPYIIDFFEEIQTNEEFSDLAADMPELATLEAEIDSPNFADTMNYMADNISMTLFVYPDGTPKRMTYELRIVPPDTSFNLKDKQVMFGVSIDLEDVNKSVTTERPEGVKPLQELIDQMNSSSMMQ